MERILLPIVKLRTVLLSWKAFSAMAALVEELQVEFLDDLAQTRFRRS